MQARARPPTPPHTHTHTIRSCRAALPAHLERLHVGQLLLETQHWAADHAREDRAGEVVASEAALDEL